MKKLYEEPEMIVRNYILPPSDIITTSTGEQGGSGNAGGGIDPDDKDPWNYFAG